jgi:hypothetical protein
MSLLSKRVPASSITATGQAVRQFFVDSLPVGLSDQLPEIPERSARYVRFVRQHLMPTVVELVATLTLRQAGTVGARWDLHLDETTHRLKGHATTMAHLKFPNGAQQDLGLAGYQIIGGKAETIKRAHITVFERTQDLWEELMHMIPTVPGVPQLVSLLSLLDCQFSDHAKNVHKAGVLLREQLISIGAHSSQDALLLRKCHHHGRGLLFKAAFKFGIKGWRTAFVAATVVVAAPVQYGEAWRTLSAAAKDKAMRELAKHLEAELEVNKLIRALGKEFNYGANPYAKGQALTFFQWMQRTFPVDSKIATLFRVVGSINDVYWENAMRVFYLSDYFLLFLADERKMRWGRTGEHQKMNRLQQTLIHQLSLLPVKIELRARAVWFYAVGDPHRFLAGSDDVTHPQMAHHYLSLRQFLVEVIGSRGNLGARERLECVFTGEKIQQWRARKLDKVWYKKAVEAMFKEDETDLHMPNIHLCIAQAMLTKLDEDGGAAFADRPEDFTPERTEKLRGSRLNNDCAESYFAVLKDTYKSCPTISDFAAHAVAIARFNGTFEQGGPWDSLTAHEQECIIDVAYKRQHETAERATEMSEQHMEHVLSERARFVEEHQLKERRRTATLLRMTQLKRVTLLGELDEVVSEMKRQPNREEHILSFLKDQVRIRRDVDMVPRDKLPRFSEDGTPYTSSQLLPLVRKMLKEERRVAVSDEDTKKLEKLFEKYPILAESVLPKRALGHDLINSQKAERAEMVRTLEGEAAAKKARPQEAPATRKKQKGVRVCRDCGVERYHKPNALVCSDCKA